MFFYCFVRRRHAASKQKRKRFLHAELRSGQRRRLAAVGRWGKPRQRGTRLRVFRRQRRAPARRLAADRAHEGARARETRRLKIRGRSPHKKGRRSRDRSPRRLWRRGLWSDGERRAPAPWRRERGGPRRDMAAQRPAGLESATETERHGAANGAGGGRAVTRKTRLITRRQRPTAGGKGAGDPAARQGQRRRARSPTSQIHSARGRRLQSADAPRREVTSRKPTKNAPAADRRLAPLSRERGRAVPKVERSASGKGGRCPRPTRAWASADVGSPRARNGRHSAGGA